jgi:hypothetical protein
MSGRVRRFTGVCVAARTGRVIYRLSKPSRRVPAKIEEVTMYERGMMNRAIGSEESGLMRANAIGLAEPKRKPDVAVAMDELDQAIGNLFDTTQMLLDRLSPIIREEPRNEACESEAPVPSACPMSDHVRRMSARVKALTRMVNNHLSALEI